MENVGQISAYYDISQDNSIISEEYAILNTIEKYDETGKLVETVTSNNLRDPWDASFIYFTGHLMAEDEDGNFYADGTEGFYSFIPDGTKFKLNPGQSIYLLMHSKWGDHPDLQQSNMKYVARNRLEINWEQVVE